MSTTENTTTKKKPTAPLTAWEMARSLVAGIERTLAKAQEEYAEIRAANPDKPHIGGAQRHLIEALKEAQRELVPDLHKIAKSNNLEL